MFDTLCGKNPDEGWEGWLKVSLSLLQMLTGIPVYTASERTEKDITQLKEAAARFMEKLFLSISDNANQIYVLTYSDGDIIEAQVDTCYETDNSLEDDDPNYEEYRACVPIQRQR